jgi:CRP-like cAMP-binding protein
MNYFLFRCVKNLNLSKINIFDLKSLPNKTMDIQNLISFIENYTSLSDAVKSKLEDVAFIKTFKKNELILSEGRTAKFLYFNTMGTVRTFYYLDGKDVTQWIYPQGSFFTSWHSYLAQEPSKESVQAIAPVSAIGISYNNWELLCNEFHEINTFLRLLYAHHLSSIHDFYKGYYFLTAKEKYALLLNVFPEIILTSNLGYIASMLGISQETLSRIRRN